MVLKCKVAACAGAADVIMMTKLLNLDQSDCSN